MSLFDLNLVQLVGCYGEQNGVSVRDWTCSLCQVDAVEDKASHLSVLLLSSYFIISFQ